MSHLKEDLNSKPRIVIAKKIHYDPAQGINKYGVSETTHPVNKEEWDQLGVRVEIGRYKDVESLKRHDPLDISRFGKPDMAAGLLTNIGSNLFWRMLCSSTSPSAGNGTTTRPRSVAFNNANSSIGVGTSSTAAAVGQTDLQAATGASNRQFKGMSNNTQIGTVAVPSNAPNFPLLVGAQDGTSGAIFYYDATGASTTVNDQQAVFRSTFLSGEANFTWNEFCVYNSSSITTGSTNTTDNTMLDRIVSAQGQKASGQVWEVTITFTLS